jgi:GNAT superfamily N-acetyltransferase
MEIRPVDVDDDAEFGRFHQVMEAAERFERPLAGMWSLEEARVLFRDGDPAERVVGLVAVEAGEVVGAGGAFLPTADNLHVDWVMPWVEPHRRGRGIGSAVLGELLALCREDGRTEHIIETAYPFERSEDHPYRRFCEGHGFALANTEVRRHLELPVDEADLDLLIKESAVHHEGYRIETFDGPIPDALVDSLCETRNQLAVDAPTGDLFFEAERTDRAIHREREALLLKQGRVMVCTLAVSADGEVVAYNDLVIPRDDRPNVYQWGTLVRREHRGRRLGMAVKARGLKELQARVGPDRARVLTCNAEQNAHMVGINERLGFRAVEVAPCFLLRDGTVGDRA